MKRKTLRIVLSIVLLVIVFLTTACAGTGPKKLSNEYVTVENYQGVEIEKVEADEATEEDVDKVVNHMMSSYIRQNELPEDTQITDEIVKESMSDTADTVEAYRAELKKQINDTKKESARKEEETRVWETVMDNSEVKEYPKDRLKEVKQNLIDLYESYALQENMEYEEYMKAIKLEDKDLDEAAKASLKQELVADVIAEKYGLKPSEQDFQKALEKYAEEYKFTNVELLLKAVSEDEMRQMVIQDNVKSWLTDRCRYVEKADEAGKAEETDGAGKAKKADEADEE
ncbi:hypothetical protein FMM74_003970 [Lachnospiraceae bacterium MD308]|jgi:FKBP-type peptidyl-prolyl cis-trans isomerase (trigger factor)|nr:hypothetical protein [Lachnospiraceae bacterium MD308]